MYQILSISFENYRMTITMKNQAKYSFKTMDIKGKCYYFGYVYHLFNQKCDLCSGETAYCTYFLGKRVTQFIQEIIHHKCFRLHNVTHAYFEDDVHTLSDLMIKHNLTRLDQLQFMILYRHLLRGESFDVIGQDMGFRREHLQEIYGEAVCKLPDLSFFQS